ncbi:LacI family DNA-binding transcriptional regulator [Cuneatibacter caecimuris]|uniref:LacI family transcriptional regulator n=1 Tax=Cuneatibacter caecimuris TaxID=1796618 RepID=A0A4Q7PQ70_9FIRM|nr:LacI family DNA-binding transcriptional regulator [Cuneatibacter caecimuris]RZT03053.1 LacI family transcriptional regulator [Cuneatibacter caecimuris]
MAVTIRQISEACGVSRGTVDRVLNNRGKVRPETEAMVRREAARLGYRKNLAGQALAARKKNYTIGVLMLSEGVEFFDEVLAGIRQAESEIRDYGIHIEVVTMKGYHIEEQAERMREMSSRIHLLILHTVNDPRIAREIDCLEESGIPVITLNTDVEGCRRLCHVGCDFIKSGRTACGLLGLISPGGAQIGVATGTVLSLGHNQRISGFAQLCREHFSGFEIKDVIETLDDDETAYVQTKAMLSRHPELTAVYVVASGASGVCRAIKEAGRNLTVIANDRTPSVSRLTENGQIAAVIGQEPFQQGYKAVILAFQYLVGESRPEQEVWYMKNEILIRENLS